MAYSSHLYKPKPAKDQKLSGITVNPGAIIQSFTQSQGSMQLLYGGRPIFQLALLMAMKELEQGRPVVVIDGANRFDTHFMIELARQFNLDPDEIMRNIFISRSFTCYQMEATINRQLLPFLQKTNAGKAIVLGLLDTFYDDQAPMHEVRQILERVSATFRELQGNGYSFFLACEHYDVRPEERNRLLARLKTKADKIYYAAFDEPTHQSLYYLEQKPYQLLRKEHTYGQNHPHIYRSHPAGTEEMDKVPLRLEEGRPAGIR